MSNLKRYRVTISRFIWAESDSEAKDIVTKEIVAENIKNSSSPMVVSLEESPFGAITERQLSIN